MSASGKVQVAQARLQELERALLEARELPPLGRSVFRTRQALVREGTVLENNNLGALRGK